MGPLTPRAASTLDRYVLREWLLVFLLAALGFPFLVMVIDLTDRLDTYLGRGIPKARIALSYVYFLPETITLVLPVAVLFAVVFTVGTLGRHSELTAAKASGISFHRLVRPLLVASLAAVVLDLGLTELAPVTTAHRAELLGEKEIRITPQRPNFVYRADGGWVYVIGLLEIGPREMRDVILEREGTGGDYPTIVVAAQRAVYDSARARRVWTLAQGTVRYLLAPGQEAAFTFDALRLKALRETPAELLAEPKAPEEMRYAELGRYIDALGRSGSDTKKLQVERALKLSVPFACIVVALFGPRLGRGGLPRHHVRRPADVPAVQGRGVGRGAATHARCLGAKRRRRCRGRVAAAPGAHLSALGAPPLAPATQKQRRPNPGRAAPASVCLGRARSCSAVPAAAASAMCRHQAAPGSSAAAGRSRSPAGSPCPTPEA